MQINESDFAALGYIVSALHGEVIGLKSLLQAQQEGVLAFIDERHPELSDDIRHTMLSAYDDYSKQNASYSVIGRECSREAIDNFLRKFSKTPPKTFEN